MRRVAMLWSVIVAMLLVSPPVSRADEARPTLQLARKHFELGSDYYNIGKYALAIEQFEKAYGLEPLPELLYNIAKCHELLADTPRAIKSYRLYLQKKPDSPRRAILELKIKNMEEDLAKKSPAPRAAPPGPVQPPPPVPPTAGTSTTGAPTPAVPPEATPESEATPSRPTRWKRIAGWTGIGVGGALLITGIVLGTRVNAKKDEHQTAVDEKKTYDELEEINSSGRSLQTAHLATVISGGVLAAGGLGLVLWDLLGAKLAGEKPRATVVPQIAPDGSFGLVGRVQF